MVFVDRPPVLLAADSVVADNCDGTAAGVRHLLGHGHQRIGFLGDLSSITSALERYEGYAEALRTAGVPLNPGLVRHDLHSEEMARAACLELLTGPNPPSALFTAQNRITVGAIHALRTLRRERSTALIGFDDFELADLLQPAVTVVAQDPVAMGKLSAELLLKRIASHGSAPARYVIPTRLITRGSGEIPPGRR